MVELLHDDSGAPFGLFREDYDHLHRDNAILVTPQGWIQSERNRKLTEDGERVSYELGYIIYRKWDEETCDEVVTDRSELERVVDRSRATGLLGSWGTPSCC